MIGPLFVTPETLACGLHREHSRFAGKCRALLFVSDRHGNLLLVSAHLDEKQEVDRILGVLTVPPAKLNDFIDSVHEAVDAVKFR